MTIRGLVTLSLANRCTLRVLTVHKRFPKTMDIEKRSNHVDRTAQNTRLEIVSPATVTGMRDESKTVKSLALQIHNKDLTFKAGQWLDVFIPGVSTVGGFSMYSSPHKLATTGHLDLAVKVSQHPPAYWVHSECQVGSKVQVRVGGDFYFDPATQADQDLLLIAGGVGINPVYSILNHVHELETQGGNSSSSEVEEMQGGNSSSSEVVEMQGGTSSSSEVVEMQRGNSSSLEVVDMQGGNSSSSEVNRRRRVMLLYSSRTLEELIFKESLDEIQRTNSSIQCQYHITRGEQKGSRIAAENISQCFDWLRKEKTVAYICGPSSMLSDMEHMLLGVGIQKDNIRYESWW